MRRFSARRLPCWACAALLLPLAAAGAPARRPADLQAEHPWVRWLPAGLPAAGYMTLANSSDRDQILLGAASPDYGSVALHESYTLANGSEGMRPVPRLRIPAHGRVRLAPGGYHLMLMEARHALSPGDSVTVVL
ncbi:MAG: copper chaperone PCu(A)C, partial [Opitutaceae bacterium]